MTYVIEVPDGSQRAASVCDRSWVLADCGRGRLCRRARSNGGVGNSWSRAGSGSEHHIVDRRAFLDGRPRGRGNWYCSASWRSGNVSGPEARRRACPRPGLPHWSRDPGLGGTPDCQRHGGDRAWAWNFWWMRCSTASAKATKELIYPLVQPGRFLCGCLVRRAFCAATRRGKGRSSSLRSGRSTLTPPTLAANPAPMKRNPSVGSRHRCVAPVR